MSAKKEKTTFKDVQTKWKRTNAKEQIQPNLCLLIIGEIRRGRDTKIR